MEPSEEGFILHPSKLDSICMIPGYTILKEMTKTNSSRIYIAIDNSYENYFESNEEPQTVAIKVSLSQFHSSESISRESEVLSKLDHINIVKPIEVGKGRVKGTDGQVFISDFMITEYCNKGDLYEHVTSRGRIEESEARIFFMQIVEAIRYLHDNNIAHRDLKLQNAVISRSEILQLIDFGFAQNLSTDETLDCKELYHMASKSDIKGTQGYIGPELLDAQIKLSKYHQNQDKGEQASGCSQDKDLPEIYVDLKKADIFSLGVMLFEMVVGVPPFLNANAQDSCYRFFYLKKRGSQFWTKHLRANDLDSQELLSEEFKNLIELLLTPYLDVRLTIDEICGHPWVTQQSN